MRIVSAQNSGIAPDGAAVLGFTQTSNTAGTITVATPSYFGKGANFGSGTYTITSTPAGVTGSSTSIVDIPVTGISAGTSYVFNITTTNNLGVTGSPVISSSYTTLSKATITATGATKVTTDPTYNYLRYETAGSYTLTTTGTVGITHVLVGGGGYGGLSNATRTGGGAGAGRYSQVASSIASASSPYTLVVGAGATVASTAGGDTTAFGNTRPGGGYGGDAVYSAQQGLNGGPGGSSGGGGSGGTTTVGGTSSMGTLVTVSGGTGNFGGSGGFSTTTSTSAAQGGTGGGAGAAGIGGATTGATNATISGASTGLTASGTAGTTGTYDAHWNTAGGGATVIAAGGDSTLNTTTAQTRPGSGGHSSQTASARNGAPGAIYIRYLKASAW